MTDKKGHEAEKNNESQNKKKRRSEIPLPFCTSAPDPEHERGYETEEPCDDARSGDLKSSEEQQRTTKKRGAAYYPHDNREQS